MLAAKHAWPLVQTDIDWFVKNSSSKKIYLTQVILLYIFSGESHLPVRQNGWPSISYPGVKPNSRLAVSNVQNEQVSRAWTCIKCFATLTLNFRITIHYWTKIVNTSNPYQGVELGGSHISIPITRSLVMASMAMTASWNSRLARRHLARIVFPLTYIENWFRYVPPLKRKPKNSNLSWRWKFERIWRE